MAWLAHPGQNSKREAMAGPAALWLPAKIAPVLRAAWPRKCGRRPAATAFALAFLAAKAAREVATLGLILGLALLGAGLAQETLKGFCCCLLLASIKTFVGLNTCFFFSVGCFSVASTKILLSAKGRDVWCLTFFSTTAVVSVVFTGVSTVVAVVFMINE